MGPNASLPISVILVEPQHPANIGSVCRAMTNFAIQDLRLVNPCNHLAPEAFKLAVFAGDLLTTARVYTSLQEALADIPLAAAATRRPGRKRGDPLKITEVPSLLPQIPTGQKLGLVFGREDSGLTTEEVAQCSHTAVIDTVASQGSLNLAQAVLLFLYELTRESQPQRASAEPKPTLQEMEDLYAQMEHVLSRIAFLNPAAPEKAMNPLKRIYHRASISRNEYGLLRGMWSQLTWSIRDWQGRKRG